VRDLWLCASQESGVQRVVGYRSKVNFAHYKTDAPHTTAMNKKRPKELPCERRGPGNWVAVVLAGAVAAFAVGCESTSHSGKTLRPTPLPPSSAPSAPSVQPKRPAGPAAWTAEANRWLGVKYRKGGTGRTGIDCSGLSAQMYLAVAGVALPRTTQDQSRCGILVSRTDLHPGDLIFFSTSKKQSVDHVGIYLGDTKFVHASPSKGVVVSSLLQDYYVQRYHSARRLRL
jgi:cell wall-associated NlpC family hydrolase